jgi:Inorganic Pyrophosphatase
VRGPTAKEKSAGNYKKGHIRISGIDIAIENPAGSKRKESFPVLESHYGYIKRTEGADADALDVFVRVGISPTYTGPVYIINQLGSDSEFDEHKIMLGWLDEDDAVAAYLANYTPGWKVGPVIQLSLSEFRDWLKYGNTREPITKGDEPGHEFYGNQYTGGYGSQRLNERGKPDEAGRYTSSPLPLTRGRDIRQAVSDATGVVYRAYGEKREVDPKELTVTQKTVNMDRVEEYRQNPSRVPDLAPGRDVTGEVLVVERNGKMSVVDGNHRATAALLEGKPLVATVVNMDKVYEDAEASFAKNPDGYESARGHVYQVAEARLKQMGKISKIIRGNPTTAIKRAVMPHVAPLQANIYRHLQTIAGQIARAISKTGNLGKARKPKDVDSLLDEIESGDWMLVGDELVPELKDAFERAGVGEIQESGASIDLELVDSAAREYADKRAAELVTEISETTRDQLRSLIADALEESMGSNELTDAIEDSFPFSEYRAGLIARTELATAHTHGRIEVADRAGAQGKRSLLSADHDDDADCVCSDAADAGVVDMDDLFVEGEDDSDFPPYHPNCWCDWVAQYRGEDDDEDGDDSKEED